MVKCAMVYLWHVKNVFLFEFRVSSDFFGGSCWVQNLLLSLSQSIDALPPMRVVIDPPPPPHPPAGKLLPLLEIMDE